MYFAYNTHLIYSKAFMALTNMKFTFNNMPEKMKPNKMISKLTKLSARRSALHHTYYCAHMYTTAYE